MLYGVGRGLSSWLPLWVPMRVRSWGSHRPFIPFSLPVLAMATLSGLAILIGFLSLPALQILPLGKAQVFCARRHPKVPVFCGDPLTHPTCLLNHLLPSSRVGYNCSAPWFAASPATRLARGPSSL